MSSSSLSSRRGLLRRPAVCHTEANPGRCHPPVNIVCFIQPAVRKVLVDVDAEFILTACDSDSPPNSPIAVDLDGGGGSFFTFEGLLNCQQIPAFFVSEEPGTFNITATYTTQNETICIASGLVIVTYP